MTRTPKRPKARPARETANTYGLPAGKAIRTLLRAWFRAQRIAALDAIGAPARGRKDRDDPLPPVPDFRDDPREMAPAFVPILRAIYGKAGRKAKLDLGLDPDAFDVTDPNLGRVIEQAALDFCEATNATTTADLEAAVARTRRELAEGVVDRGESLRRLTSRINGVFDRAEKWRARRIAQSEASRAHHAAMVTSAEASGVVAGFEVLVSADACPLCRTIARRHRYTRAGEPIAVIGDHPTYGVIRHPPFHPHCNCSLVSVLKPEYSGEPEPDWANGPLEQPEPEPVDYGLAGEPVPVPDLVLDPEPAPPPPPPEPKVARDFRKEDGHEWAKSNYERWAESLTKAEAKAVELYTSGKYRAMNTMARTGDWGEWGEHLTAAEKRQLKKAMADLDSAMAKGKLKEDVTVYRGLKLKDVGIDPKKVKPGDEWTDIGFTSTTVDPTIGFPGDSIEVRVPAGTPAGYFDGEGKASLTVFPGERELLLGREANRFRVVGWEKRKDSRGKQVKWLIVELVPDAE